MLPHEWDRRNGDFEHFARSDTRLKRDVAVKVLPDSFVTDPDRLARFNVKRGSWRR